MTINTKSIIGYQQLIEVLILYKQSDPQLEVTLSEKSINEAVNWFQGNLSEIMNSFNK